MPDVPPEAAACPSCGTDLTAVQRVRELAGAYFNESLSLAAAGRTEDALARVMAALALDDAAPASHKLAGKLLWRLDRPSDAARHWRRAAQLAPDDADLPRLLAEASALAARAGTRRTVRTLAAAAAAVVLVAIGAGLAALAVDRAPEAPAVDVPALQTAFARAEEAGRTLQGDLDRAVSDRLAAVAALDDHRRTHPHTADELASAAAQADAAHTEAARLSEETRRLADDARRLEAAAARAREEAASARKDLDRASAAGAAARGRVEELQAALAGAQGAEARASAALADARRALAARHAWMDATLLPRLAAARPARADVLALYIAAEQAEAERLAEAEQALARDGGSLFGAWRLSGVRDRLRLARTRLDLLEREYAETVKPWQDMMNAVEADVRAWQDGESP
jgi:hypothetical protein